MLVDLSSLKNICHTCHNIYQMKYSPGVRIETEILLIVSEIDRPVCSEELVALPESIVEKHIDSFQCQFCVVNTGCLFLLHASRCWFWRVRH